MKYGITDDSYWHKGLAKAKHDMHKAASKRKAEHVSAQRKKMDRKVAKSKGTSLTRPLSTHVTTRQAIGNHGSLSESHIVIRVGAKHKHAPKGTSKFEYLHQGESVTVISEGTQQCLSPPFACTVNQLVTSVSTVPQNPNILDQWSSSAFDLNPNEYNTGSAITGSTSGIAARGTVNTSVVTPTTDQIFLHNASISYMLSNMGTVPCFVDCYWFVPKKDLAAFYTPPTTANPSGFNGANSFDPWNLWTQSLNNRSYGQNLPVQTSTLSSPALAQAGNVTPACYGMKPQTEKFFNTMFKLVKSTTMMLQSGESHVINAKVHFNKLFNKETLRALSINGTNLAHGTTLCPLFVVRPGPVGVVSANNGVPLTTGAFYATTGTSKVSIVHTSYFAFSSCEGKRLDLSRQNAGLLAGNFGSGTTGGFRETEVDDVDTVIPTVFE